LVGVDHIFEALPAEHKCMRCGRYAHGAGRARGFERQNDSRCEIFDNDALAPAHGVLRIHQNRAAVVSQRLWGARVVVGSWSGEAFLECGARDVAKARPARGGSRILAKARLRLQSRGISIPGHRTWATTKEDGSAVCKT
jgi:uncharacterized protein (UPF0248 family)